MIAHDLDVDIQKLPLDEAIGVIRTLLSGEWVSENAVRLAIRTQIGVKKTYASAEEAAADWFTLPPTLRTKAKLMEMLS